MRRPPPAWGRLPLRARLAVLTAAAVAVSIAGATFVAYAVLDRSTRAELDRSLARQAAQLDREIRASDWARTGSCEWITSPCAQIVRRDGAVEPDEAGLPVTPRVVRVANGSGPPFYTDAVAGGLPVRIYTEPLPSGGALEVGVRADGVERNLRTARLALLATALAGVGVAALLGYLVARGALRPVIRLTRAAERITATGDPSHRMAVTGGDELARLAASFNAALAALEESVTAQRRLVADASHELRTPLTSLRSDVELLDRLPPERRERVLARLRGQLAGLTGLVGDLIELARGDAPDDPVEDVRLDALVAHCVGGARARWPDVAFTTDLEPRVVSGMPRRLTRAVTNLLDNAAKFGGAHGPVEVALRGDGLTVRDHGPGIDPADLPHVFDRFYRSAAARGLPGSGLGLAIVAQVAAEHAAGVSAEAAPGGGTVVRLAFPPSPGLP
ncbi:HAMP domain-containing sensor histidine kinase [Actinomadura kijaniata]|uniref:HAMP domain-containing sensor histidine kinase n=1 Tax=Actinomadura kijaniata TaxID=46161 RepID=UPI000831A752|nr:HAMP domain-containing sensor histidine kinase [Actinomadura kijaniata]